MASPSSKQTASAQQAPPAMDAPATGDIEQQQRQQQLYGIFSSNGLRIIGAVTGAAGRAAERHEYGEMQTLSWLAQQLTNCFPTLVAPQTTGGGDNVPLVRAAASGR